MGNKRLENLLKSGKVPIKGEVVRKVKHSSVRIENPLLALYRGTGYFSLARTFRTVWGGVWLDAYNQAVSDIAGTITVGVSYRCQTFVTIMTNEKDNTHKRL